MPKSLEEFENLQAVEGRAGGRKVDWNDVCNAIVNSQQAFTVREVWETFVDRKVTLFRTKNALDKFVETGKLRRMYDGKRFYYAAGEQK